MEQYTASNGVTVKTGNHLGIVVKDGALPNTVIASKAHENALREFFLAEEDERLGRWRWPENPDYVVYPRADHVAVVNEQSGNALRATRDQAETNTGLCRAARAYFDAHPEPKPWHNAKPWETWLVTIGGIDHARTLDDDREFRDPGYSENSWMHITDSRITTAHRIWPPEESS